MDQPAVRRRVNAFKTVYEEARQAVEERATDVESDLWAWIGKVQQRAQKAQRQIDRARTAEEYYSILGLQPGAELDEVKAAWRKQMRKNHPDRFAHDPVAEAKALKTSQSINVAYQELSALLTGRENRAVN